MYNTNKHNVLNIFIASPGDVNPERLILSKKIDFINKIVRNIDWHIDLYGGEDTLPGAGRPQALINEEVDRCDLFIGVLWKRWGQSTPSFSSGFEEELDRAIKRYFAAETPEIWLFFKEIEESELSDVGPQLARVLEFRKQQEVSKQLFFKEFSTVENFGELISGFLLEYILKSSKINERSENKYSARTASLPQSTEKSLASLTSEKSGNPLIPKQILELVDAAAKSIKNDKFQLPAEVGGNNEQFNIARFYLIASTWLSQKFSTELLDNHCINILFKYREKVELTAIEHNYIFRTIIGHSFNNVPGWYWMKDTEQDEIRDMLFGYALADNNPSVRINSIEFLKLAELRPREEWLKNFNIFEILSADKSDAVKKSALSYLASLGDEADLKLLDDLLKNRESSIFNDALFARISIMAKIDANSAFSDLLNSPENLNKNDLLNKFKKIENKLDDTLLINALNNKNSDIKLFAANALLKQNKLTLDLIDYILKNSNYSLKEICYREMLRQGKKVDPEAIKRDLEESYFARFDILLNVFNQFSDQELIEKIDWYEIDGPIAYNALIKRKLENWKDDVRQDLNTQFERLRETSVQRLKLKYAVLGDSALKTLSTHDEFIRLRYIAAGLSMLSENFEPQDIEIARKYINSDDADVKKFAIKIISEYGDPSDAESLLKISKNSYGELKISAAKAAIKLSPGMKGAAGLLISTNDVDLIEFALEANNNEDAEQKKIVVESLLQNENENIRSKALYYLINKYPNDDLERLLRIYIDQGIYYYNVVCWLDRTLYAKPPLRDIFIRQLSNI